MFYRRRPKIDPCGTDASTGNVAEVHPFTTTLRLRPYRQLENSSSSRPVTPSCSSFARSPLCHTRSNAPLMSRAITREGRPESRALCHVLARRRSRSEAERPFLSPNWRGEIRCCSFRWSVSCSAMTRSSFLLTTDNNEMGR